MVKGRHVAEPQDESTDMQQEQRQQKGTASGMASEPSERMQRQHGQHKSDGTEHHNTHRPGSAGLTDTLGKDLAHPGSQETQQQQAAQDTIPTHSPGVANINADPARHSDGQTLKPATAAAAADAVHSSQAAIHEQLSAGTGDLDTTGQFHGQLLDQEQAGAEDVDAANALMELTGTAANAAALNTFAPQSMPMQQPPAAAAAAAYGHGGYSGVDYSAMYYPQQYPLPQQYPAAAWPPPLSQDQQGAIGYSAAPKHSVTGGGSKSGKEYYRQKLAEILREANRVHELPHWDVHVSHRPKNGKPDAVYIAPDGTRYKSRAILRDALNLKPGPGARRAKVLQQQQLQAAMAATAAANAAAAAAAAGGDPLQNTGAAGTASGLGSIGLVQPAATAVSGNAPAAASLATYQIPNAAPSAAAAAAAAGMQQPAGITNAAAGSGPVWYEKVLKLTQTVVDSLEPAMRGQYKVIHMLRCPVITGYVVEYCRRTTKGAIRNRLSGRITADGNITCGCTGRCNWHADIPSSMFEEHSGSTVRRPAQFIYIIGPQNSKGEILENYNITLKELLAFVNSGTSGASTNSETVACVFTPSKRCRHCMSCSEPAGPENGTLLECTGCPLAYHRRCLGIEGVVPDGARWYCPYCLQACRDPPGYRDSHLHRMCQQAVLNTRQIPKPPVVRQHYSGARALDQMSVPPPPPPLPGQHKPAYSTADTAVSTAATSQQQQQQPAGSSLSSGSAAAADSAAAAAGAASADSRPGSSAAIAGPFAELEVDEGSQQRLMTAELEITAELDEDLQTLQPDAELQQRQSGPKEGEIAGQRLGVELGSLGHAAAAAADTEATFAAAAAEKEKGPQQRQQRKYVRKKGVPEAAKLAASAPAPEQAEEPAISVGGDPLEPRYCICNNLSYGTMVQCENDDCPIGWFHYACVGMTEYPKGKWYCQACIEQMQHVCDSAAAAAGELGEDVSVPPEPAAPTATIEDQPAASSQQAAGKAVVEDSLATGSEPALPAASAEMDVDQAMVSGHAAAAAAAGVALPSEEVIELLTDDVDDEHELQQSTLSDKAPAVVTDHEMTALLESRDHVAQGAMPGHQAQPSAASGQYNSAGAVPLLAAAGTTRPHSRPIKLEVVNPAQQLLPSAAAAAAAATKGGNSAMVEQQPPHAAGGGGSAVMEQQGTVMKPAAGVQSSLGALGQGGTPAAKSQLQQMQQWQWLQAWQSNRALSAAMQQQQQQVSSAADTATNMQLNSSQQQLSRRTSSGNAAASSASAPTYKLNAPKPRLPAAARAAAAAAASADSSGTAKDSKDTSATAAGSSGTAGAGAASPSSTFKRRTPQDMRRMVVRNLHALIGPHTESAWQEFVKRGTTRGAQPSQWQCEAFMAEVFGDKGGPNADLWPGAEDLRPEGVMGYLARVIEWASGVSLTPEQVNDCFVAGEHVWKVNDDKLALLGLYPWNWTLPLNPQQVATTSSKPSREELAPVASAAVAAAAAKLVAAMTNRSKPASPTPLAAALGAAVSAPSGSTQVELQKPPVSAPVSSAAMQQQFAAPSGSTAPAAVHPGTSSGSAGAVPAAAAALSSPVVPVAARPAGVAVVNPSASYVSAATAIPGLPMITPGLPAATEASSQTLQRLVTAGMYPVARPTSEGGTAAAQQSGQRAAPAAVTSTLPAAAAAAVSGGLAPGTGIKVLQGMSAPAATSTPIAVPAVAVKGPAVVPTNTVPVTVRPNAAARPLPRSSSPADDSLQGAALVAALQHAGASARGATAAAAAVGLLPLQQTVTAAANAGGARLIKLEPQQQQQLAVEAAGLSSAVVAARDKADSVSAQQVDPSAAVAAARAAVAARQQQLLAQQQQQQQRGSEVRDTITTQAQPAGNAGGSASTQHGVAAADITEEAHMVQDEPEAVEPDLALPDDSHHAADGADPGSLDTADLRSVQTPLLTAAAAAGNVTDSGPSLTKQLPKPAEVTHCITRQLRLLSPQADEEWHALSTARLMKSTDLGLYFQKVVGPETGVTALPWPAEEWRQGSREEGAAVYMARLLSVCSGKVISPEVYKKCVMRQDNRWVLVEGEFRNLGITPWTWSIPFYQQVPAMSDLSVTLATAQAAATAGQAASDTQKHGLAARQAQGSASLSFGELSEQTLVSFDGTQLLNQTQQQDSAGAGDNAVQAAAAGATAWGQPPPARPPSKDMVATANTEEHMQKLRKLNSLMKRKFSLDQEDHEDPFVKTNREIAAVDQVVTKLLLLQQLRRDESALAAELDRLAGVRDTKKEVTAAQARLHAGMTLKEQQHQQEVEEMQRQQQEFMAPGLWDPDTGVDLISGTESDSGSMMGG